MARLPVIELKTIDKESELRGYSRMKKADLVPLLAPEPPTIRDDPVPESTETNIPVHRSKLQRVKDYAKSKMNNLVNWIVERIPPKPKAVDRAYNFLKKNIVGFFRKKEPPSIEEPFEVTESMTALKSKSDSEKKVVRYPRERRSRLWKLSN